MTAPADRPAPTHTFICWAGETTFSKSGFPVLGTMGARSDYVVVMRAKDFAEMAKLLPTVMFNLGTQE